MALGRKKLDDKILKTLRELVSIGGNKECFDCGQKGPTYVNMTIGSFVCTSCSGILRGLTPPHRVKSISMATFTQDEIEFLKLNGNENCSRTWLGLWDAKRTIKQEHRDFMMDKYERKRYYLEPASPLKSLQTNTSSSLTSLTMKNVNENLIPLKTPTLTPPTSLRLHRNNSSSCNGLNSVISSSSSTGSGHGIASAAQLQQQFTPDDSDFFGTRSPKILPPNNQKSSNLQRKNGIKIKKPVYEQPPTFERNQKNGLLSTSTSSNGNSGEYHGSTGDINANKFTPNSDFVADFGSASIINNANNDKNHYGSANSLKESGTTGLEIAIQHPHHGKSPDDDLENFADFDHNPIFNSAGLPVSALFKASSSSSNNNASVSSAPTVDRYAALKDLDEQFREFKLDTDSKKISTLASNGLEILNSKSDHHSHSTINPFKSPNPFQQQQEQHEQRQMINWSIATANGTESLYTSTPCSENRFYANSQYTGLAQGGTTNMYNGNITTGVAGVIPVGYHTLPSYSGNGYSVVGSNGTLMSAYNTTSSSGGQQLVSNMPAQNVGNPFMVTGTSTRKSNNPFL
uniref:Putative gtpase-activating protein n=1 Tax=Anopheles triannulatus TaxID=58253 RepID=A0A2M4ALL3_9DIPT